MADSNTVQVGCTHPLGMHLHVYDWTDEDGERVLRPVGMIVLAGNGEMTAVDADLFDKWMALNGETDTVKNGEVFTQGKAKAA